MAKNQLARNSAASALSAPLCLADDVLTEDSGVLGPVFLYRMQHLGKIPVRMYTAVGVRETQQVLKGEGVLSEYSNILI